MKIQELFENTEIELYSIPNFTLTTHDHGLERSLERDISHEEMVKMYENIVKVLKSAAKRLKKDGVNISRPFEIGIKSKSLDRTIIVMLKIPEKKAVIKTFLPKGRHFLKDGTLPMTVESIQYRLDFYFEID